MQVTGRDGMLVFPGSPSLASGMLYLSAHRPRWFSCTVVSPRAPEASEGGVPGRARRGAPHLRTCTQKVWRQWYLDLAVVLWFPKPRDEWNTHSLEMRLSERLIDRCVRTSGVGSLVDAC